MKKVLFIVGPTCAGKSDVAFELAKRLGGEIISADSMQVYKGMDIGTAKPSRLIRKKIPHHLIDIVAPSTAFSAFRFRQLALKAIKAILKKGKIPIVTGGSGLYTRVLLEGISGQPAGDATFRKELSKIASKKGLTFLYEELRKEDPVSAEKIKPTDEKRIIRALEIIHVSGRTPSEWFQKKVSLRDLGFDPIVIGITKDRPILYRDIEQRVDAMFRRGLPREVQKLSSRKLSKTAREAIGYREILQALPLPKDRQPVKELIKRNTRRFAKRQMTWFRRDKEIVWFSRLSPESCSVLCDRILLSVKLP